jgi:BASS family bile acid:Na+ symporter
MVPIGPVLAPLAAAAVFTVMFALGRGVLPRELLWVRQRPGLVARGLVSVLVLVPVIAVATLRLAGLPRWLDVGVALMAVSPGAPVALQRSLGAGGHRSFAPALQLLVAALAVLTLPLSIVLLDRLYAGHAWIHPVDVARQVFLAQLLPLGLGLVTRHLAPARAVWLQPRLARFGMGLLLAVALIILALVGPAVAGTGPRLLATSAAITALALAAGHVLGGPAPETRTAVAITSAARNPGLALLVATLNPAPPEVGAAIMAHLLVSAVVIAPYAVWRQRRRP